MVEPGFPIWPPAPAGMGSAAIPRSINLLEVGGAPAALMEPRCVFRPCENPQRSGAVANSQSLNNLKLIASAIALYPASVRCM